MVTQESSHALTTGLACCSLLTKLGAQDAFLPSPLMPSPPKRRPLVYLILTEVNKAHGPVPGDIGMQGVWGKRYLETGKTAKWYFQDFFLLGGRLRSGCLEQEQRVSLPSSAARQTRA